jgi:CheY-like chemotaxis protein
LNVMAGHKLFFIALIMLLASRTAFAAETARFEKDKNSPGPGLVTRTRWQQEAQKKQPEYDVKAAIPDVDAAQRDLEGLNNTISNAMYLAEQSKRADAGDRGVFTKIVIATALLAGGIYLTRKFGHRIGFLFNVREVSADALAVDQAEEKTFSDFVTAFKVGPRDGRRTSTSGAGDFVRAESSPMGESSSADSAPLTTFFHRAPNAVGEMRSLIQEITRGPEQGTRQNLLTTLAGKIHEIKCMAGLREVLPVWQLGAALEGLVKQLADKDRNVTPSTLRTVASAIDLLQALSVPGINANLMSDPPIRLLAVDDDALSRHAVSFALKKAFNKPDLAENGEAALALVSHIKYDAIFLDVQMPGMNGFETCSKIHATELNRTTPVVFVTCQSDFDARAKSTLSGGIDLIGKPFLTFEITVKALTLALRGRLNPKSSSSSIAAPKLPCEGGSSLAPRPGGTTDNSPGFQAWDGVGSRAPSPEGTAEPPAQTAVDEPSSTHKSREQRRRDRRKIAQATRNKNKDRKRHGRSNHPSRKNENDELVAAPSSTDLSSDIVANAFLSNAPANIETLQDRLEQIFQVTDDELRQEIAVELYLAVHSLAAEASLAKLQTIFQLSAATEALLKELIERPASSMLSSLSVVANALELLHDFCDAKLTSDLIEQDVLPKSSSSAEDTLATLTSSLASRFEQLMPADDSETAKELVASALD